MKKLLPIITPLIIAVFFMAVMESSGANITRQDLPAWVIKLNHKKEIKAAKKAAKHHKHHANVVVPTNVPAVLVTNVPIVVSVTNSPLSITNAEFFAVEPQPLKDEPIVTSTSVTNINFKFTTDLMNWSNLGNFDLATAAPIANSELATLVGLTNGERVIEVFVSADAYGDGSFGYWVNKGTISTVTTVDGTVVSETTQPISVQEQSFQYLHETPYPATSNGNIHPMLVAKCMGGEIVIGILVLVVGGIIIYVLYKTCKRVFPPAPGGGGGGNQNP